MVFRGSSHGPRDRQPWYAVVGVVASAAACVTALAVAGQAGPDTIPTAAPTSPAAPVAGSTPPAPSARRSASPVTAQSSRSATQVTSSWPANRDGDRVMDSLETYAAAHPARTIAVRVSATSSVSDVVRQARAAGVALAATRGTATELAASIRASDVAVLGRLAAVRMVESDPVVRIDPVEADPMGSPAALLARYTDEQAAGQVDVRLREQLRSAGLLTSRGVAAAPGAETTDALDTSASPTSSVFNKVFAFQGVLDADPSLDAVRTRLGVDGDGDGDRQRGSTADSVVAVIDSGIDSRHPELAGKVLAHVDLTSRDATCGAGPATTGVWDDLGHGTHVAGIVAGTGVMTAGARANPIFAGVAPGAALVDLKVFDCTGSTSMDVVDSALTWVLDHRAALHIAVVNLSLGSSTPGADGTDATSRLVNQLQAVGVQVVVAAGNDGDASSTLGVPAVAEQATTVSAANAGPFGEYLASFASRGPTADGRPGVDVVAPGASVRSARAGIRGVTAESYVAMSGTSMAAPYVAGIYALLAAMPGAPGAPSGTVCSASDLSPACATGVVTSSMTDPRRSVLRRTATPWFAAPVTGDGMVRASAALEAALGTGVSHSVPAAQVVGATVSASRPYTVAVDTSQAPVAASVLLDSALPAVSGVVVTPLDREGVAQQSTCGRWTSSWDTAAASACDLGSATLVRGGAGYAERGSGIAWLTVRTGSDVPVPVTLLLTGAVTTVAQVHAWVNAAATEGVVAGRVTVVRDSASDVASSWHVAGDARVSTGTDVVLPAGAAGTSVAFDVALVDDAVPQGHAPVRVALQPVDDAEPLVTVSVATVDADAGTPDLSRLLVDGAQPVGWTRVDGARTVGSSVVGVVRSAQLAADAGADVSRWSSPFTASASDGSVTLWNVGRGGTSPGAQVDVLDVSADGRLQLLGMYPDGSGALPGDDDLSYELFLRDSVTGTATRINPVPAQRRDLATAQSYTATLVAANARLSVDGATVAYFWPHSSVDTSEVDLRLVDVASGTSTVLATLRTSVPAGGAAELVWLRLLGVTSATVDLSTNEPRLTGDVATTSVVRLHADATAPTTLSLRADGTVSKVACQSASESPDGREVGWQDAESGAVLLRDTVSSTTRTVALSAGEPGRLASLVTTPDAQGLAFARVVDVTGQPVLHLIDANAGRAVGAWASASAVASSTGGVGGLVLAADGVAPGDTNAGTDLVWGRLDPHLPLAAPVPSGPLVRDGRVVPSWQPVSGADHYTVAWTDNEGRHTSSTVGTLLDAGSVDDVASSEIVTIAAVSSAGVVGRPLSISVPQPDAIHLSVASSVPASGYVTVTGYAASGRSVALAVEGPCTVTGAPLAPGADVRLTGMSEGACTVTATVAEDDTRLAASATATVTVTASTEHIDITAPPTLAAGDRSGDATLVATSASQRIMHVSAIGPCSVPMSNLPSGMPVGLTSTGGVGRCTVTVWLPAAEGVAGATATTTILVVDTVLVVGPARLRYTGSAAVSVASRAGSPVSLSVSGPCTVAAHVVASGASTTVRALAGAGSCIITGTTTAVDGDTATQAVTVRLALVVPSWRDVPLAAGSYVVRRGASYVLGAASPRTNLGGRGRWSVARVSGAASPVRVSVVSGRLVLRGSAAGRVRITLTVPARAGYSTALARTWYVTVR